MKTDVPEGFKEYCLKNEASFTEEVSFEINSDLLKFLQEEAIRQGVSFNCYINFCLKEKIAQLMAEQEGFSLGLIMYSFELYDEDEFAELIDTHQRILIFDEHLVKKGVIMSVEEFEKFKEIERKLSL